MQNVSTGLLIPNPLTEKIDKMESLSLARDILGNEIRVGQLMGVGEDLIWL